MLSKWQSRRLKKRTVKWHSNIVATRQFWLVLLKSTPLAFSAPRVISHTTSLPAGLCTLFEETTQTTKRELLATCSERRVGMRIVESAWECKCANQSVLSCKIQTCYQHLPVSTQSWLCLTKSHRRREKRGRGRSSRNIESARIGHLDLTLLDDKKNQSITKKSGNMF